MLAILKGIAKAIAYTSLVIFCMIAGIVPNVMSGDLLPMALAGYIFIVFIAGRLPGLSRCDVAGRPPSC